MARKSQQVALQNHHQFCISVAVVVPRIHLYEYHKMHHHHGIYVRS
jgi:hypothetical protein